MNVFIYRAALHCEECGRSIREELDKQGLRPVDPEDESSYDSDEYPKGPYPDGGGEADTPQHCDTCGMFLENPLTSDGIVYAEDAMRELARYGTGDGKTIQEWAEYYSLTFPDVPDEEDVSCPDPGGPFFYAGKKVAEDRQELKAWMTAAGFYPEVFFISDHGNAHLLKDILTE